MLIILAKIPTGMTYKMRDSCAYAKAMA